jgi:hypothetical protein
MGEGRKGRRFPVSQGVTLPEFTFFCVICWVAFPVGPGIRTRIWNTYWRRSTELATSRMRTGPGRSCSLLHRSSLIWRDYHDSRIPGFPHRTCMGTLSIGSRLKDPGTQSDAFSPGGGLHITPCIEFSRIIPSSRQLHPTATAESQKRQQTASIVDKSCSYAPLAADSLSEDPTLDVAVCSQINVRIRGLKTWQ